MVLRYLLPICIVLLSLPLAIFAALTTIVAAFTLFLRVCIVYFDVGLALVRSSLYIIPPKSTTKSSYAKPRRHSSSTNGSNGSSDSRHTVIRSTTRLSPENSFITPLAGGPRRFSSTTPSVRSSTSLTSIPGSPADAPTRSDSFASLVGAGLPDRDYEGVGGWRDLAADEDAIADEARWTNINSRLVLPAVSPGVSTPRPKRHSRSLTAQSQIFRMSPVQSRARSPHVSREEVGDYFGQVFGLGSGKRKSVQLQDEKMK
ncbi:hypothetical protein BT63DRAFT_440890 [Microthyrium microscopicum]|uniref:Uncharacterized protein n=1 Tax=Microthyrium microscopicum TaxID=703497 RepID=A0A6A6UA52_9PEZI|nr:hypothetical protein BT63DRAFT_440890 [Microthyrium microscopicum]